MQVAVRHGTYNARGFLFYLVRTHSSLPAMFRKTLVVAGLTVNVSSYAPLSERGQPLAVLFLLHGRLGSAESVSPVVEDVLRYAQGQGVASRELVIVTFVSAILV